MRSIKEIHKEIEIKEKEIKALREEFEELKRADLNFIIKDITERIAKLKNANIKIKSINVSSQIFERMNNFQFLNGFVPIYWAPVAMSGKFMGIPLYENHHLKETEYHIGV